VHLSAREQIGVLAILLLTSKGAAGVAGSGFITLAATLAAIPTIPSAALALLLGIDRFMSEVRSITNLIGNAIATVAIAHWDHALDLNQARDVLAGNQAPEEDTEPETVTSNAPVWTEPERLI